jgi:hypothetical protein
LLMAVCCGRALCAERSGRSGVVLPVVVRPVHCLPALAEPFGESCRPVGVGMATGLLAAGIDSRTPQEAASWGGAILVCQNLVRVHKTPLDPAPQVDPIVRDRPSGKVSGKKLLALLELQGRCCALSGIELTPQTVSLDHIVPLAEGGTDDMGNVQLVHAIINSMKGLMSQADFVKWCKLVSDRHS